MDASNPSATKVCFFDKPLVSWRLKFLVPVYLWEYDNPSTTAKVIIRTTIYTNYWSDECICWHIYYYAYATRSLPASRISNRLESNRPSVTVAHTSNLLPWKSDASRYFVVVVVYTILLARARAQYISLRVAVQLAAEAEVSESRGFSSIHIQHIVGLHHYYFSWPRLLWLAGSELSTRSAQWCLRLRHPTNQPNNQVSSPVVEIM